MKKWRLLHGAVLAGCVACTVPAEAEQAKTEPIAVTPDVVEKARALRRKSLQDPNAATFEGEKAALQVSGDGAGDVFVCGWMTGKTAAAEGRQIYYVVVQKNGNSDKTDQLVAMESLVTGPVFYKRMCSMYGIQPD